MDGLAKADYAWVTSMGANNGSEPAQDGAFAELIVLERRIEAGHEIPDEPGRLSLGDIQNVVKDQYLAVDVRTGANPDNRHIQRIGYGLPDLVGHAFEQHDVRAGVLQLPGAVDHLLCLLRLAPLDPEAADLVHGLWFEPKMRAHRYVVPGQVLHDFDLPRATFEFDHHGAAILHQAHGILERLGGIRIAHERHVRQQERTPQAPRNITCMVNHVGHRHWHGRIVPLDDHAQRITHQHEIRAAGIDQCSITGVVRCQAGNWHAALFHFTQGSDIDRRLRHAALFELCVHAVPK